MNPTDQFAYEQLKRLLRNDSGRVSSQVKDRNELSSQIIRRLQIPTMNRIGTLEALSNLERIPQFVPKMAVALEICDCCRRNSKRVCFVL